MGQINHQKMGHLNIQFTIRPTIRPRESALGKESPICLRNDLLPCNCSRELRLPSLAKCIAKAAFATTIVGILGSVRESVIRDSAADNFNTFWPYLRRRPRIASPPGLEASSNKFLKLFLATPVRFDIRQPTRELLPRGAWAHRPASPRRLVVRLHKGTSASRLLRTCNLPYRIPFLARSKWPG